MEGGRAGGPVGGKLGPLPVEMRQSGAPRGEGYKDCEPGTVPSWVQSLMGGGPAKHARNPEGLQPKYQREDAKGVQIGGVGGRCSPPLPKSRPGKHQYSGKKVSQYWRLGLAETGSPAGYRRKAGRRWSRRWSAVPAPPLSPRPASPSAFRGAEAETPRPSWPLPLVAPRPPSTPSAF